MTKRDPEAIRELFETISPSYDLLNDLFSLGLHRVWKRQAVAWLGPQAGQYLLDLCCGTGDLSLVLANAVRPGGLVLGLDVAAAPLQVARQRCARQPWLPINWRQADAMATGLVSESADGAVMAFGLCNMSDPEQGLAEMRRLLRPGARAVVLDFNRCEGWQLIFNRFYLRHLVVPGAAMFGLAHQYAYLESSIEQFATGAQQQAMARSAGFRQAHHQPIAAGLMGMLQLTA